MKKKYVSRRRDRPVWIPKEKIGLTRVVLPERRPRVHEVDPRVPPRLGLLRRRRRFPHLPPGLAVSCGRRIVVALLLDPVGALGGEPVPIRLLGDDLAGIAEAGSGGHRLVGGLVLQLGEFLWKRMAYRYKIHGMSTGRFWSGSTGFCVV